MCRRCGEPDRRGSAGDRRRRAQKLLDEYGNGTIARCYWCAVLVGKNRGYLTVPGTAWSRPRRLEVRKLEQDRLMPGGSYAYWNLVPSCPPCNKARTYTEQVVPEGCVHGSGVRRVDPVSGLPAVWHGPDDSPHRAIDETSRCA